MLNKTTASLKPADVEKTWIVIDAQDAVVGRLASYVALRLRGKHRPDYTPHVDCGDHVVIVNAEKVRFTGKKLQQQTYYWHTGHPGGIKERTAEKILGGKHPDRVIRKAVERMLPKESPLARKQMTQLHVFAGPEHTHQAQSPQAVAFGDLNSKNVRGRLMSDVTNQEIDSAAAQSSQSGGDASQGVMQPAAQPAARGQGFDALASMSSNPEALSQAVVYEPKIDSQGRAYATGKRKNAIARVWIKPGRGSITINGRDQQTYFARPVLRMMIAQPLAVTDRLTQFDVTVTVEGSGLSGQAGAIRHGLSKALTYYEPSLRVALKPHGFLTRDSRVVERKKYGRAKARRSFQFSKR